MRYLRIAVAVVALALVAGCSSFQNPFSSPDDQVLLAGDLGGGVCTGVMIMANQKGEPQWLGQAREASAAARGVLLSTPADYSVLALQLHKLTPPDYAPLTDYFLDRLRARATNGVIVPDTQAFAIAKAFLDACDQRLGT